MGTLTLFLLPAIIFIRAVKNDKNIHVRSIGLAGLFLILSMLVFNLTESFLERARPVIFYSFYLVVFVAFIETMSARKGAEDTHQNFQ